MVFISMCQKILLIISRKRLSICPRIQEILPYLNQTIRHVKHTTALPRLVICSLSSWETWSSGSSQYKNYGLPWRRTQQVPAKRWYNISKLTLWRPTTYTGCPKRNVTDITQNTYIQSWTVTEIMAGEVWNFDSCYTLIDYQIHIKTRRNMWFL